MTTRVTVEPSSHHVEVITMDANNTGPVTSVILAPGSQPQDIYIHSTRTIIIRELPTP